MNAVLIVTVLGVTMPVQEFPTYEECEHMRTLVFEVIKTSSTVYRCKEGEVEHENLSYGGGGSPSGLRHAD